jgi:hypothetical protein
MLLSLVAAANSIRLKQSNGNSPIFDGYSLRVGSMLVQNGFRCGACVLISFHEPSRDGATSFIALQHGPRYSGGRTPEVDTCHMPTS